MISWLLISVIAPRWFLASMVFGSSTFALSLGFIAGRSSIRREELEEIMGHG